MIGRRCGIAGKRKNSGRGTKASGDSAGRGEGQHIFAAGDEIARDRHGSAGDIAVRIRDVNARRNGRCGVTFGEIQTDARHAGKDWRIGRCDLAEYSDVVDVDTDAGWQALNEFLPESLQTPIARTPGGGYHVYFSHKNGLSNGVRVIEGCDLRTDGGYVVAPPSQKSNGKTYRWREGMKITDVKPADMPIILFDILLQGDRTEGRASYSSHLKKDESLYKNNYSSVMSFL